MFAKIITTLLGISLCSFAVASESMDNRIESLEMEMQEISTKTPQETLGINFTSAHPEVLGEKIFITFDILYWHAKAGGTDYAFTSKANQSPAIHGTVKTQDFDWEWGLKVGLGYNILHDGWDICSQYTYYNPDDTDSTTKAPPSSVTPQGILISSPAIKAKSNFEIYYHNVNVEMGRNYFISSFLSFRPFLSVKTTWMDIEQRKTFTGSPLNSNDFTGFDYKGKDACDYWGIGPRIGVNSRWHLGYGFSYFGDVAASILYSYFKTFHKESQPEHTTSSPNGITEKMRQKFHRFIPFVQMFTGLEWDGYVNHRHQHIRLKLGYEVQYYWRINQFLQPDDVTTVASFTVPTRISYSNLSEDVMFYGITGEFRLDF